MTRIGTSTLDVYPLCLGANTFGWTADKQTSLRVIDEYADAGGNFLDTADSYSAWKPGNSGGESEEIIGSWLQGRKRDETVVATKVGKLPGHEGLSRSNVLECADSSLRRLGTDFIDLYYAHRYDKDVALEESVGAFAELQRSGKIREIGLSNFSGQQVRDWIAEARKQGVALPVAVQPHYNLVWRKQFESDLEPVCEEYDLGVFPYYSLASGFLTGKFRSADQIVGDRADSVRGQATDRAFEVVDAVCQIAASHNVEPSSIAIAWLLTKRTVVAPIASARVPEQVPPLLEGVSLTLSNEDTTRLEQLSAGLGSAG